MDNGNTSAIEVYNMFGDKVYEIASLTISHQPLAIDISSQPNGIYFLRIKDEKGNTHSQKLILSK
jgi:hypothetical protein